MSSPLWFEAARAINALGTLIIGVGLALIAWRQHAIAREELKLSLWDKRFAVHEKVVDFFAANPHRGEHSEEDLAAFGAAVWEARFLYSEKLHRKLQRLYDEGRALLDIAERLDDPQMPDATGERLRAELLARGADLLKEREKLTLAMAPFLSFRDTVSR